MTKDKADKIYAAAATVAIHALLALALLFICLRFPPEGMEWPPTDLPEITLQEVEDPFDSGQYVRLGDELEIPTDSDPLPSTDLQPEPTQTADATTDAGKPVPREPAVTTSTQPSEAKATPKPQGPTKEQIAAQQEAQRRQQAQQAAADATSRAFGAGRGTGAQGSNDGNTSDGQAVTGSVGNGLTGRTLEHWSSVKSTKLGVISVRVTVDSQGRVTSATYYPTGSSGAVASDLSMRNQCVARSRQCRFSVLEGSRPQSGLISWTFK